MNYKTNKEQEQFPPTLTEKGTELPLMNLRGNPYMKVPYRLVWFRERFPEGSIQTEVTEDGDIATAKATIAIPINGQYVIIATAHKKESKKNFADNYEKAETGAVGRALGYSGFGTQYEPQFDEGERIVDAPITKNKADTSGSKPITPSKQPNTGVTNTSPVKAVAPESVANTNTSGPSTPETETTKLTAVPNSPENDDIYYGNLIEAAAREVIEKGIIGAKDLKGVLNNRYGVSKKTDLTPTQSKEFLGYLQGLGA